MAITLNKPQPTDIYDIDIFNENSTTIENAVNQLQTEFTDLQDGKLNLFNIGTSAFNIDSVDSLSDGIYYLSDSVNLTGTFPETIDKTNMMLLVSKTGTNSSLEYIFDSSGNIYQRTIENSVINGWVNKQVDIQLEIVNL